MDKIFKLIESYESEMIDRLCDIVSIPSVEGEPLKDMPFGLEVDRALKYTLKLSEEIGLRSENIDNYAGHADYGDGDETIGAILHLDVVPAGQGWTVDPFAPKLVDGKVYGRGTTDNKGPLIAILFAIKSIIDSGIVPKKKIRVIYGTNEETRWQGISYYLEKCKEPDFTIVPDAEFPMIYAEKGIYDLYYKASLSDDDFKVTELIGGNALNSVADFAKISLTSHPDNIKEIKERLDNLERDNDLTIASNVTDTSITISVKGIPAHASVPEDGKNAIAYLAKVLSKILPDKNNIYDIASFIDNYLTYGDYNGVNLGIGFMDEPSGNLTCNLGTIKLEDNVVKVGINIRYPVTMNHEEMMAKLRGLGDKCNIEYVEYDHLKPIYQPLDGDIAQTLLKTYREVTGDYVSEPISIGAGTYARALTNAIAYGGQMQSDEVVPHQDDEYLTVENLVTMTKIYAKALYELACK